MPNSLHEIAYIVFHIQSGTQPVVEAIYTTKLKKSCEEHCLKWGCEEEGKIADEKNQRII